MRPEALQLSSIYKKKGAFVTRAGGRGFTAKIVELEKSLPRGSEGADRRAKSEADLDVRSFHRRNYERFEI